MTQQATINNSANLDETGSCGGHFQMIQMYNTHYKKQKKLQGTWEPNCLFGTLCIFNKQVYSLHKSTHEGYSSYVDAV